MSLSILQWIHITGLTLIALALGGFLPYAFLSTEHKQTLRRPLASAHGLGLLLLLISGFGMIHVQGFSLTADLWIWAKIIIWLTLGGSIAIVKKSTPASIPNRIALFLSLILLAALFGLHHTQLFP